ncbi:protein SDE2 homolog [Phalaenopsis equestris]|uniref:protein SDE2 homolog n=1 Tax=Phalaenopsis equestris TaxID=78828 RepID=UPI0009E19F66|nr:protein SDE2 homolog [Phalaenopsis equestris]
MAIYQIFVKLLDGRTQCLQISSPTISGETLKRHLFAKTRIPYRLQLLITGSRIVSDETLISASSDGFFPSCGLLLRLPGGKGGFGSLLRGAATKAGQKKTNNFDACRDMSGRRLRHVNAEKKLEEWKAEADDRRLEKLAEQFLKKKAKETKKNSSVDVDKYLEKYREDSAKCMEEVEESVRRSFDVYKDLKRKICPSSDLSSKRFKIWLGKNKIDESCSEDDDESDNDDDNDKTEDKSVVLDDGHFLRQKKETNEFSLMVVGSCVSSDGELSSGSSGQSNLEQANGRLLDEGSSENVSEQSHPEVSPEEGLNENCDVIFPVVDQSPPNWENDFGSDGSSESESIIVPESTAQNDAIFIAAKEPKEDELKPELHSQTNPDVSDELAAQVSGKSSMEEPLNFNKYNSATELEVLGMDRLKMELQARGLKCGGTLQERASRLFLLKTTPLDKLPKKLLAKPPCQGK